MAKQERDKLAPTGHPLGMLLAMMMSDCRVKYRLGKELQNLTENAGYSYHGWVSPFSWLIQQLQLYSDSLTLPCIDAQLRWHSPGPGGSVNVLDRSEIKQTFKKSMLSLPLITRAGTIMSSKCRK